MRFADKVCYSKPSRKLAYKRGARAAQLNKNWSLCFFSFSHARAGTYLCACACLTGDTLTTGFNSGHLVGSVGEKLVETTQKYCGHLYLVTGFRSIRAISQVRAGRGLPRHMLNFFDLISQPSLLGPFIIQRTQVSDWYN